MRDYKRLNLPYFLGGSLYSLKYQEEKKENVSLFLNPIYIFNCKHEISY